MPFRTSLREVAHRTSVSLGAAYDLDHLSRRIRRILHSKDRVTPVSQGLMWRRPNLSVMKGRQGVPEEQRAFDKAIRSKDLDKVRATVEENPWLLSARTPEGLSPLMVAIYSRAENVIAYLASKQLPGIFEAAAMGDSDRVSWLLQQEPGCVNAFSPDGWTPLHLAAHFGRPAVASLLISNGARIDAVATNGIANQPLQAAVAGSHSALVGQLISAGADVNHQSHGGFTAAHVAAENNDVRVLEQLKAAGANLSIRTAGGKTPLDVAREGSRESARRWLESADRAD